MKNKKLKNLLDAWTEGIKIRGIKTPPLETMQELFNIYYGNQKETINSSVIEILNKCGITVEPNGIGWIIC